MINTLYFLGFLNVLAWEYFRDLIYTKIKTQMLIIIMIIKEASKTDEL